MAPEVIELISYLNIPQLLAMGVMFWFFYTRLDGKMEKGFEKVDLRFEKIDLRFEKVDARFDKIEERLNDLDKRLCRLEGAFASKECCYFKEHHHSKAE